MATPIVQDLRVQPLKAKLYTSGLSASDGFWVKEGTPVYFSADETVRVSGSGDPIDAYTQIAMNTSQYPTLTDVARFRIPLISRYNYLIRATAGENLAVREQVGLAGANNRVMKLAALAATVGAGSATASTVDATTPTVALTGGKLPVQGAGVVFHGATTGNEVQILL